MSRIKRIKSKPEIWWCVKDGRSRLFSWTVKLTREDCIEDFITGMTAMGMKTTWEKAYRKGYRVVKIKVEGV